MPIFTKLKKTKMSFGPQKVEKKIKKRKKTRKRLRLGDQMFHVAINEKKTIWILSDFRLSKREICEFYKKHFIIEF